MKYIRTSEKIFEIVSETKIVNKKGTKFYYLVSIKGFDNIGQFPAKEWENTPRADTIEELCDEFVVFDDRKPFNEHYPFLNKNCPSGFIHAQDMVKALENKHLVVYGAIWTDKGLIYVAKMNDKGELELL